MDLLKRQLLLAINSQWRCGECGDFEKVACQKIGGKIHYAVYSKICGSKVPCEICRYLKGKCFETGLTKYANHRSCGAM